MRTIEAMNKIMGDGKVTTYYGQCLCGTVIFTIDERPSGIYQCHCSECRKITGTSSNASCLVSEKSFSWVIGKSSISSYTHKSGYRSDFCSTCGSLLPNKIDDKPLYWVPVGTLKNTQEMQVKAHLCISSKASWEKNIEAGIQYPNVPDFQELCKAIGK